MSSIEIPRISATSGAFRDSFLKARQPVVITDLFAGQPIAELSDSARFLERTAAVGVHARRNYVTNSLDLLRNFTTGRPFAVKAPKQPMMMADYFEMVRKDPATPWYLTELPTPEPIRQTFEVPRLFAELGATSVRSGLGKPADAETSLDSVVFVGNPGNSSDLHTDWDGSEVFITQIFGRKRYTLFPPRSARKLLPVDVFATVKIRAMAAAERQEFLRYAGGRECVLGPGETLYVPAFFWHHIEYVDFAASLNFRMALPHIPELTDLIRRLHRDMYTQNLLVALLEDEHSERTRAALAELRAAYEQPYPNARAKYQAMRVKVFELCQRICPEFAAEGGLWVDANEFLEPVLCRSYLPPPEEWTPLRRRLWSMGEKARFVVRRLGYKLASI
jgi:hypothetical protein